MTNHEAFELAKTEHPTLYKKYLIALDKEEEQRTKLEWAAFNSFIYIIDLMELKLKGSK